MEKASLRHAHKFVVGRWSNLRSIRRHIVAWLLLVGMMCGLTVIQMVFNSRAMTITAPQQGGVYAEGTVDSFRTLNPLFTSSPIERSATKLLFSGLLRYDEQGILQPDIAQQWTISNKGKTYTLTLRQDAVWHDGQPVTADDVVFTVNTLKDPKVNALQGQSWRGITVAAPDKHTVVFTLPNAFAPFASQLTSPILPQHILKDESTETLQENDFGKAPVGSGPFQFESLKTIDMTSGKTVIQLTASDSYWQGKPLLNRFTLTAYGSEAELVRGFKSHEINAANDLSIGAYKKVNEIKEVSLVGPRLNNGVYAFFNTDSELLKDVSVRQALVRSTNTVTIGKELEGSALQGPILSSQLPEASSISQSKYDTKQASELFDKAGFTYVNQKRQNKGKPVVLRVASVDTPEYKKTIGILEEQWKRMGINIQKRFIDPEQIQQSVLQPRDYDVLVYELEIGGDPDVYAYWHSSQADVMGANFSNYRSPLADDALVAARLRSPWDIRDTRYKSFAEQWTKDAPAVALYQSNLHYATYGQVTSVTSSKVLPTAADRFSDVANWSIQQDRVYKTP